MNITVNGKETMTDYKTVFSLPQYKEDQVVILNGLCISADRPIKDGDELFFISRGAIPGKDEMEAMLSSRHTPGIHKKIKSGKVAVAGLGGLGSHIAAALARCGVGKLLLVDFDTVDPSNLNRQHYSIDHLWRFKTEALKEQLEAINPYIKIETVTERVTEENVLRIFGGYPIVCEAFDDPSAKAMLVNAILEQLPSVTIVAASGMAGYESANLIRTRHVMKNLYICGDEENEAREGMGLMAPRVMVCAGHQANMALRLLLDIEKE